MAWTEYYVDSAAGGGGAGTSGSPWTWAEMVTNIAANAGTGNRRYNVKGSFAFSALQDFRTYHGTAGNGIWIRAYSSTIGDGGLVTITNSDTSVPTIMTGDYYRLEGLDITQTVNREVVASGTGGQVVRCPIHNQSTGTAAKCVIGAQSVIFCDLENDGGSSGWVVDTTYNILGCRIVHAGRGAVSSSALYGAITGNTFIGKGTPGIAIQAASAERLLTISNNRIFNCTTGINFPSGLGSVLTVSIFHNIIYDCTTGISCSATWPLAFFGWNAIGDATSARYSGLGDFPVDPDIILTADPFIASGSRDLSLNETAGGGALLRSSGFAINEFYDWSTMVPEAVAAGGGGGGFYASQSARML